MPNIPQSYFHQESERLKYRALTEQDKVKWQTFFPNNTSLRFVGVDPLKKQTPEELSETWINRQFERYAEDGFGMLAVIEKTTNELIGLAGIMSREIEGKKVKEIGYSFLQETWGKGYATEAARQMHQFGKENKLASHFVSIIHIDNFASMRVAEKNGMSPLFPSQFMDMPVVVYGDPAAY